MATDSKEAFVSLLKGEAKQAEFFQRNGMKVAAEKVWKAARQYFPDSQATERPRIYDENLGYEVEIPPFVEGSVEYEGTVRNCKITLEAGYPKPIRNPMDTISIAITNFDEKLRVSRIPGDFYLIDVVIPQKPFDLVRLPSRHIVRRYLTALATFSPSPEGEAPALTE